MSEKATSEGLETGLRPHLQAELFRALADPTRLQLLVRLILAPGPQTVTEVSGCCGVHLSGVSRHLAVLRDAGVVRAERSGREVRYSLEKDRITAALRGLADAIDGCREACCPRPAEESASPAREEPR